MPRVTVVLTSYNHEKYLREAIDSVLAQTYEDFELIIWDDNSHDNSWQLISGYSDNRIRSFRNDKQRRGIWGINRSISEVATGEYIAIHHSDDVWEPDKLEKQVAYLDAHQEIGAVFSNALAIDEDSNPLDDPEHFYSNVFNQPNRSRQEWLHHFFYHGNGLCHPSVLIRKLCYDDCGLYRYGLSQQADFDMWVRLCLKYEIHVIHENLVKFRVRENEANTSGNRPDTRIRGWYEFYKVLENYNSIIEFEELVRIFPAAEQFRREQGSDVGFALGMVALKDNPLRFRQLFGQDLLFGIFSNPPRAEAIQQLYGFGYQDFIVISGKNDIFGQEIAQSEFDWRQCAKVLLKKMIGPRLVSRIWHRLKRRPGL